MKISLPQSGWASWWLARAAAVGAPRAAASWSRSRAPAARGSAGSRGSERPGRGGDGGAPPGTPAACPRVDAAGPGRPRAGRQGSGRHEARWAGWWEARVRRRLGRGKERARPGHTSGLRPAPRLPRRARPRLPDAPRPRLPDACPRERPRRAEPRVAEEHGVGLGRKGLRGPGRRSRLRLLGRGVCARVLLECVRSTPSQLASLPFPS